MLNKNKTETLYRVIFYPDNNHKCVNKSKQKFAVFLPDSMAGPESKSGSASIGIIRPIADNSDDCGIVFKIDEEKWLNTLPGIAVSQCKIDVFVELDSPDNDCELKLIGFRVPAIRPQNAH